MIGSAPNGKEAHRMKTKEAHDRILTIIDAGLQTPMPEPYADVAPIITGQCARCDLAQPEEGSDFCARCCAILLGEPDPGPPEPSDAVTAAVRAAAGPLADFIDAVRIFDRQLGERMEGGQLADGGEFEVLLSLALIYRLAHTPTTWGPAPDPPPLMFVGGPLSGTMQRLDHLPRRCERVVVYVPAALTFDLPVSNLLTVIETATYHWNVLLAGDGWARPVEFMAYEGCDTEEILDVLSGWLDSFTALARAPWVWGHA